MEAKRARAGGDDRLGTLTDDLVHRVLFFLPARQVVRTSVLSKRWTDLWRSVPSINLSICDFLAPSVGSDQSWAKMENFTANLLMRHRAPRLDAFRFTVIPIEADGRRDADRWIRRALEYRPSVLEIYLPSAFQYQLPHLGSCHHLKRLHLTSVSLDHCFAENLRCGCPVLEDLVLRWCRNEFDGIRSDTLKNLVLYRCSSPDVDIFVISAPHLTSLDLDSRPVVSLEAGNSLATASVTLIRSVFSLRDETKLLGSLFNVTSLELQCFHALAMLDKELDKVPMFDNLRTMSLVHCFLSIYDGHKLKALGRLLQKSPKLQELTLDTFRYSESWKRKERNTDMSGVKTVEPVEFPMLENLRNLFLNECDLLDNFQLLGHCLRNSPNLEKLTVKCCKLSGCSTGGEGNLVCFECPKLKSTEIIYEDDDNVTELVRCLLGISGRVRENTITLTKA